MPASDIIIPRYRDESPSFQRATDWLFGSQAGYERYMEEQKRKAAKELAEIAEAEKREKRRHMDGLGELRMRISLTDYMRWQVLYPGCWEDDTFVNEYHRDNPQARANRPEKKTFAVGEITV